MSFRPNRRSVATWRLPSPASVVGVEETGCASTRGFRSKASHKERMAKHGKPGCLLGDVSPAQSRDSTHCTYRGRAPTRAQEGAVAQWQVPRDCAAVRGNFMVPSPGFCGPIPAGTVTRLGRVSFNCPNL
jgi:hypothetical protein